jgi:hypothetical protein
MSLEIVDLNVGGVYFAVSKSVLLSEPGSFFTELLETKSIQETRDGSNRLFIDRDGNLFNHVLEYLRKKTFLGCGTSEERRRLREEATFFKLPNLIQKMDEFDFNTGFITLTFREKFQSGHNMDHHMRLHRRSSELFTDLEFRKISRIGVCGKVHLCRSVFGEDLNERFIFTFFKNSIYVDDFSLKMQKYRIPTSKL